MSRYISKKNEVQVYLSIYGDLFDPDELTRLIKLKPIYTHIKGETVPLTPGLSLMPGILRPLYKETVWDYGSDSIKTNDTEVASSVVEKGLKGKVHLINNFVKKHNLYVKLFVVPRMDKKSTPYVHFSPNFVQMLSELHAGIDMDIYVV